MAPPSTDVMHATSKMATRVQKGVTANERMADGWWIDAVDAHLQAGCDSFMHLLKQLD